MCWNTGSLHFRIKERKYFLALSTPQSVTQPALGADDGQDRRGKGQMQQDSTHITLQEFCGDSGPFPLEVKLLQCPPSLEEAAEPAAKAAPSPRPQPHSLSQRCSCSVPAMGSVPPPCPCRKQLPPPPRPVGSPCESSECSWASLWAWAQHHTSQHPSQLPLSACRVSARTES